MKTIKGFMMESLYRDGGAFSLTAVKIASYFK